MRVHYSYGAGFASSVPCLFLYPQLALWARRRPPASLAMSQKAHGQSTSVVFLNLPIVMRLPDALQSAIQKEVERIDRARLAQAAAQLTERYQAGQFSSPVIHTEAQRAAYLAVRVPAIFSANLHVFSEIRRLAPDVNISGVLDLGSGPGTALHAAAQVFPSIQHATLVESDAALINVSKRLGTAVPDVRWLQQDIRSGVPAELHDLVVISYTLGELSQAGAEKLVMQAWAAARQFLVVIEPGTVRGFGFIHAARALLIGAGAHLLAPCPHPLQCPMAAAGDWCHFAQRVERTSLHRQLKDGALGYEDEKFSYVVGSREEFPTPGARIVRHPQKLSGHVKLLLCTAHGLERRTITKSQKERYREARRVEWGDGWNEPPA
ncbi:MAG: hypothetical protein DMG65_05810 [Candidatus Angelobacter sp. Gp1-AA117]|nr:MAG: hypothetical protein DMG65_05810 [Candidatus Angelobacter sp. Gp1-AA117]